MAASSIHEGIVLFRSDVYGAADDPMDTVLMRDGVANGLLHAMDSMAQCRVNWVGYQPGGSRFDYSIPIRRQTSLLDGTWVNLRGSPFGVWPITLKSDGSPYKLRIRAAVSSAKDVDPFAITVAPAVSVTQAFRFVLAPLDAGIRERDVEADHAYQLAFTSGSPGVTASWIAGTTRGAGAYATYLELSRERAEEWTREVSVWDAVSASGGKSIRQCLVALHGFAYTGAFESSPGQNDGAVPVLRALHAEEFAG